MGEAFRNLVKCALIMVALVNSRWIMEDVLQSNKIEGKFQEYVKWLGVGVLVMLFGTCDVLAFATPFTWTYLFFYAAFTAIYFFTEQSPVKSFLLIFFIYIF